MHPRTKYLSEVSDEIEKSKDVVSEPVSLVRRYYMSEFRCSPENTQKHAPAVLLDHMIQMIEGDEEFEDSLQELASYYDVRPESKVNGEVTELERGKEILLSYLLSACVRYCAQRESRDALGAEECSEIVMQAYYFAIEDALKDSRLNVVNDLTGMEKISLESLSTSSIPTTHVPLKEYYESGDSVLDEVFIVVERPAM